MSATIWNSVNDVAEIDRLLTVFAGFHDSCLREAHVWTEHWVDSDLRMSCTGELDTRVCLLVQRQRRDPSAIELLFEQVVAFHLNPSPHNYDSIILEATMLLDGDIFYWADVSGWSRTDGHCDEATWIAAKKVSWRDASDWMGAKFRYRTPKSTYDT